MGVCSSKSSHPVLGCGMMPTTLERRGTDSSAPLMNNVFQESDGKLTDPNPELVAAGDDHLALTDKKCTTESMGTDIYYDAVDEENKFPLTMAEAHHFEAFDGLEERIQQALASNNKKPLRNAFTDPPAHLFMVRGPDYLREGKGAKNQKNLKVPSKESPYELIGVSMYKSPNRIHHVAEEIGEIRRFVESFPADKEGALFPEFLFINWILSPLFKKEIFIVQHAFRLRPGARHTMQDEALNSAFSRFRNGTDAERNAQFKYMFRVVDAPGAVKNAISYLGGERPVLIGKSLTTTYQTGANHLEINMDVSSSRIASAINGIILKNVETVVMDCSWLLEGQRQEELPERVLAKIRWIWNCVEDVVVHLDEAGERV